MKKIILGLALSIAFASCSKNSEQIEVAKKDLKKSSTPDSEIENYKYDVVEIADRDIYKILSDLRKKRSKEFYGVGSFENASEQMDLASVYLDSLEKAKGDKFFYKVHFYRTVDKDTVSESILYLNDKNQKIGSEYLK